MKRFAPLAAVLLVAVGWMAPAQSQNLSIGAHASGNFATFQGDTDTYTESLQNIFGSGNTDLGRRAAVRAGVFVEIPLTEVVSLRPELMYTQKGSTVEASASQTIGGEQIEVDLDETSRFHYLQIPVLATAEIPTQGPIVPRFYVGPAVGFDLSAESEVEVTVTGGGESGTQAQTNDVEVEDVDVGAVVGGEFGYRIAPGQTIALDVRYNPSVTAVNSEGDFDVRNDVLSVGVSYRFAL